SPGTSGDGGIWTAAPSHAHAVVIAAAAIAKSAVAIPIEVGPAPPFRTMAPRLSCPDGGAKPPVTDKARRFCPGAPFAILASRHAAALIGLHQGLRPPPQCGPNGSAWEGPNRPQASNTSGQPCTA